LETQATKLKIEFGKPQYDWLPVRLAINDFQLEFSASGVLYDPLADLVACLLLVAKGVDASVDWWLEPAEVSFRFAIQPAGIQIKVLESDDIHSAHPLPERQLVCMEDSYEAMLLPFWRALRKLKPTDFGGEAWYPLPLEKIEELTRLIKAPKELG
jgi:hypothetical protein